MKRLTAFMAAGVLAGTTVLAQEQAESKDKYDSQGAPPAAQDKETGKGTLDKLQQGAKNMFTELKFEDLPQAVQNTVKQHAGAAKVRDIDREDRTGRTIYEVEFDRNGEEQEIHVAENGTLVSDEAASLTGPDRDDADNDRTRVRAMASPKFSELPPAVQKTVQQHGAQTEIEDIDRERENGKTYYEVEFRREGPNREIRVAEDGTLMKNSAMGKPGSKSDSSIGTDDTTLPGSTERRPGTGTTVPDYVPERK